ncbi:LysM peptidoglycan-binding domain-containing protein [Priestia flexa]|uniref:LysM peptidoglycan-binding domain-containing protein n=1 Tax=Priestia flexa TaxID=86664 RepID=UPI003F8614BC
MARLGNINIFVEKEDDTASVDATSYPVEKGIPLTDHVEEKPDEFSLTGSLTGSNYEADYEYLRKCMKSGTILTFVGRNVAKDVIILDMSGSVDASIANGKNVSIKLRKIRIATTPWVKVQNSGKKKPVTPASTAKPASAAVYHLVKKGDTYWMCWKKYGTSIAQLRLWNKYPDRRIPIGVKLRVR